MTRNTPGRRSVAAQLPGPVLYWTCVALVLIVSVAVVVFAVTRIGRHRHEPPDRRRRLGVDTQARLATDRELAPLLTRDPEPGRFVLARYKRRWLATESHTVKRGRPTLGAVAVFGPSQSGKTTGLIDGVRTWHGPAIVSSVKNDLLRATIEARRAVGDVKVFDPLGTTGIPTAGWTPLRGGEDAARGDVGRADTGAHRGRGRRRR